MNPVDQHAMRCLSTMPDYVLTQLAMGPIPSEPEGGDSYVAACRVCVALDRLVFDGPPHWVYFMIGHQPRTVRNARALYNWHHCVKLSAVGRLFDYGNSPEGWRRCLVLYHAAGWTG